MRPVARDPLRQIALQRRRVRTQEMVSGGSGIEWTALALANGWTTPTRAEFEAKYSRVYMHGHISPGSSLIAATLPPEASPPYDRGVMLLDLDNNSVPRFGRVDPSGNLWVPELHRYSLDAARLVL